MIAIGLLVMMPWPILGLLLTAGSRDSPDEWVLLFGGITSIPMLVVYAIDVPDPRVLFVAGVLGVWVAAVVLPGLIPRRASLDRRGVAIRAFLQSLFSFAQSLAGVLLIAAKEI